MNGQLTEKGTQMAEEAIGPCGNILKLSRNQRNPNQINSNVSLHFTGMPTLKGWIMPKSHGSGEIGN